MSEDGIFLRTDSGLTVLKQRDYDSEALLQTALADYPEVLAGPTTTADAETRLLLIRREMGVPTAEAAASTFSLDHLFVDADGVPVLVEVKRSSDTRIRREVVGQMLDYAANAVRYWPVTLLRDALDRTATDTGTSADQLIAEFAPEAEPDEFWRVVDTNLRAGRVRMVFVADRLPDDLVRIIEFLNEQMSPAEVLGVELRQYVGGDHVVFVPRVVGRTSTAVDTKAGGSVGRTTWTRDTFLAAAQTRCPPAEVALMQRLLDDVDRRGHKLNWGSGVTPGVAGWYSVGGRPTGVWVLNANNENPSTRAYLVFYLSDVVTRVGADRVEAAAQLLETIPSMRSKIADARASGWKKYPSLYLGDLAEDAERVDKVFATITALLDAPPA